jgi:hypothetical protein
MNGHTPGPWTHYHARLRPQYPVIVNEIHGPAGQVIVQWGGFDAADGSKSVRKANARLISSAPMLLEALKRLTDLAIGPAGGVTQADKREAIANAIAAITAATGDTK